MRTKKWLTAAILPASLLAFCSIASAVDCTLGTVVCNQLTKGSTKFKPVLHAPCPPLVNELISIKGTLGDCTTNVPGVQIISGSVKGTITTNDCSCTGLLPGAHPVLSGALTTTWKFATKDSMGNPIPVCDSKTSVLNLSAAANINAGVLVPGPPFNGSALYGEFNLSGAGVSVAGDFQGGDGGATSSTTGSSVESASFLVNTCLAPKGLKGFSFGATDNTLQ
jgi:hypothetical protein